MAFPPPYDDKELFLQVAAGNQGAFKQLTESYWNKLYTIAFTFLKSPESARDLVQDVFLKVWLKRHDLEGVDKPAAWLFILTRNEVINMLKKKRLVTRDLFATGDVPEEGRGADSLTHTNELRKMIQQGLELLPPQQKLIFILSKEQELSHEEICRQLNLARSTVKNSLVKTLAFLRNYLQQHTDIPVSTGILLFLLT